MTIMIIDKREIKSIKDLDQLKDVWATLENGDDMTIFQNFTWHRLLAKEWHGWKLHPFYSKVVIYIAYQNGKPLMIFPAIIYTIDTKTRWFGSKKGVYLMGQGSYSDYMNVIYNDFSSEAFEAIITQIRSDFPKKNIFLTSVRPDTALSAYLKETGAKCEDGELALHIDRKASLEDYQNVVSKKTRSNLKKALNRMERDNIKYTIETVGMITDPKLIDELVKIHVGRITIKNTNHSDFLHTAGTIVRTAYRRHRDLNNNIVAMSMQENPESNLILIRFNDKIVGYQYGMKDRPSMRLLQTCFEEQYSFYSPGFRGTYDYILSTYENDEIQQVDFLRGSETFKYRLGCVDLQLLNFTL